MTTSVFGGPIKVATKVLTNAEVIALPTTPVEIIAAPVGATVRLLGMDLKSDISVDPDGAYTNVNVDCALWAGYHNGAIDATNYVRFSGLAGGGITNAFLGVASYPDAVLFGGGVSVVPTGSSQESRIALFCDNDGDGPFEDGHASNTLTVTIYYMEIPL